jgi:hypothetical protein
VGELTSLSSYDDDYGTPRSRMERAGIDVDRTPVDTFLNMPHIGLSLYDED